MNMKHVGLLALGLLGLVAGCLFLGNLRPAVDPANAVASYFLVTAHTSTSMPAAAMPNATDSTATVAMQARNQKAAKCPRW